MAPLLIDTCAAIWLASDEAISEEATVTLDEAAAQPIH